MPGFAAVVGTDADARRCTHDCDVTVHLREQGANNYDEALPLLLHSGEWSGWGSKFNALGTGMGCGEPFAWLVVRLLEPDSSSSDSKGATTRNASTSTSTLDISFSFSLKTSLMSFIICTLGEFQLHRVRPPTV